MYFEHKLLKNEKFQANLATEAEMRDSYTI